MRRFILAAVLTTLSITLFAQETDSADIAVYGLGDQTFSISAGIFIPLFLLGIDGTTEPTAPHLRPGATGSLQWGAYLNNSLSVGAGLGGMFALTVLRRTLIMIPIEGHISYAIRFYPFEVLLHGALGVNLIRLENDLYVGPIVRPGFSFYWNYSSEWTFGLRTDYWFTPEFYLGETPPGSHTTFGNFLSVTLSTLYHF